MSRKLFQKFIGGILFGFGLLVCLGLGIMGILARNGADNLNAELGDKLVLAKWNAMVNKLNKIGQSQQVVASSILSTTSTSFVDTDMTITMTTSDGKVLLDFNSNVRNSLGGQIVAFDFVVDGTRVTTATRGLQHVNNDVADTGLPISMNYIANVTAGTHTFKVQWKTAGGTANLGNTSTTRVFKAITLP